MMDLESLLAVKLAGGGGGGGSSEPKLLWENASPSSTFPGQYLTIPTDYTRYLILWGENSPNPTKRQYILIDDSSSFSVYYSNVYKDGYAWFGSRYLYVQKNLGNIYIGTQDDFGCTRNDFTLTRSTNNLFYIPLKIYGIK